MIIKGIEFEQELISELGRFVVLWNMFENQFFSCMMNDQKIIELSDQLTIPEKMYNAFKCSLVSRMEEYSEKIEWYIESKIFAGKSDEEKEFFSSDLYIRGGFYDQLPSKKKKAKYEKVMKQIEYIMDFLTKDELNICGCLFSMYRIRNNLMHGVKVVYHFNSQVDIFKSMNDILENIGYKPIKEKN